MANDPLRLRYPLVLIHGLGARDQYGPIDYFHGIPRLLREAGNRIFIPRLTSFQSLEHRAAELKTQIDAAFPEGEKLNFLGHSMGGLDARYAVSQLGLAERVVSVTTIGTPHRGSVMGDLTAGALSPLAYEAVKKVLALTGLSPEGLRQISTRYSSERLQAELPDAPGVAYFSAMSVIREPVTRNALPVFWIPHRILKQTEGENDGFVSLHSAKWGEHLLTVDGDHYAQIGQFLGKTRGLDHIRFYSDIVSALRARGF
jgi:triacylglycerol lipase